MIRKANWVVIPDFEGHEINMQGEIRNATTKELLKGSTNQTGVRYVNLRSTTTKQYETRALSVLIAAAFCPGRSANQNTVLHLDGNLDNMNADNLMWATRFNAIAYHKEIMESRWQEKRRVQEGKGQIFKTVADAAKATGCVPSAIDYAIRYNDNLAQDIHVNFVHRIWPGGYTFRSA